MTIQPGIYNIIVAGGVDSTRLTRHGNDGVTILPPSAASEALQEWRITHGRDGNILIEVPSHTWPGFYLSWKGEEPKQGSLIVYHVSEIPFHQWHVESLPNSNFFLHAAGSDLGIRTTPSDIDPPFLELQQDDQFQWLFERLRDE